MLWSVTNVYFKVEKSSSVLKQLHYAFYQAVSRWELHLQIENKNGMTKEEKKALLLVPCLTNIGRNTKEKCLKKGRGCCFSGHHSDVQSAPGRWAPPRRALSLSPGEEGGSEELPVGTGLSTMAERRPPKVTLQREGALRPAAVTSACDQWSAESLSQEGTSGPAFQRPCESA